MNVIEDQPEATPATETPAPKPSPKARKPKAKAAPSNGKTATKVKAKAAPKAAVKAAKPAKKAAAKAKRQRNPENLDQWGYRKGTIRSRAAAIYAGKKGATLAEVKDKVGSIQFNVLTELEDRGFKLRKTEEKNRNGRKVTRYFLFGG